MVVHRLIGLGAVGALVVALSVATWLATSAQAEWDPARPAYDYEKFQPGDDSCVDPSNPAFDHGRCGPVDGPVFNSFVNVPSFGDERSFFDARLVDDVRAGAHHDALYDVTGGSREVELRVFIDNDANERSGYKTIAQGTQLRVELPTAAGSSLRARALVSSSNATPQEVEDTVDLVDSHPFRVAYVPGSAVLWHGKRSEPVDDRVVSGGAWVSNKGIPGEFLPGFDKAALVNLRVLILPVVPPSHTWRWVVLAGVLATLLAMALTPPTRRRILRVAGDGRSWYREEGIGTRVVVGVVVALLVAGLLALMGWLVTLPFA